MSEEDLIKERIRKLEEIKKLGINPYPYTYKVTDCIKDIKEKFSDLKEEEKTETKVSIAGRLMSMRKMGKAAFANIKDTSGNIQFYIRKDDVGEKNFKLFKLLDIGDIIGIEGTIFKTKTGELSIYTNNLQLLTKSLRPLHEKFNGLKAKLEFNLPEDNIDFKHSVLGNTYHACLFEFASLIRNELKYNGELSEKEFVYLEKLQEQFYDILQDRGINIFDERGF